MAYGTECTQQNQWMDPMLPRSPASTAHPPTVDVKDLMEKVPPSPQSLPPCQIYSLNSTAHFPLSHELSPELRSSTHRVIWNSWLPPASLQWAPAEANTRLQFRVSEYGAILSWTACHLQLPPTSAQGRTWMVPGAPCRRQQGCIQSQGLFLSVALHEDLPCSQ